jgi:putative FmdB family regulatory protein
MAIYEYRCGSCNAPYTKVRGIAEPEPEYLCDTCSFKLIRVYSSVGVAFNGGGFYSTDNKG